MMKSVDYPPCVLLAGVAFGSVLGVIRSLGSRGVPVYVLAVDQNSSVFSASKYCYKANTIKFKRDSTAFCEDIADWCRAQHFGCRPLLLPLTDSTCTCVAEGRTILEEVFMVGLGDSNIVLRMLDKAKANELARRSGLNVPQSCIVASVQDLKTVTKKMHYPVIVKPTWWRSKGKTDFKAMKFENDDQLLRKGGELVEAGASLVVQEFIPGDDTSVECYLFYRSQDVHTTIECTGLKIRQLPPGAGIMASGQTVWLPQVAEMSKKFLDRIDFCGLGGIEYKRYNGKSYFIEMNVRLEGIHPLAIQAGIDFAWHAYSDLVLKRKPPELQKQKNAYYLDETAYLVLLGKHFREVLVIREVLGLLMKPSLRFAVWSINDPKPWIFVIWQLFRNISSEIFSRFAKKSQ